MMYDELDNAVQDIVAQLKSTAALVKVEPEEELTKDMLEEFIIKNSGKLIARTLTIVDNVQDYIQTAPDAKDVAAFAELLKAASTSIDVLNKVYISIEKNKTSKELKQMDVDSREKINVVDNATFLLSRKEIMQELLGNKKEDSRPPAIDV